jgi:1-acyl-sn-glycerol-3-phosphate acyltransferase
MKHENYSTGYDILRVHARLLHRFIHRNITVTGLENLPKNTPVIFAPNHENALMDAMAVLLSCPMQPTWLARADIFGNPVVDVILKFLKISPVYRIRDGKESLAKNDEVFDLSIRVLKNKKSLALFPEAMHNFRRQTIAHKKAVPRIAFMAEENENFTLGLQIIPVGLYYSDYYKVNRELIVSFGKPIFLRDYEKQYRENKNTAIVALRTEIYNRLVPLTLNIKSKQHYDEYETLLEINDNNTGYQKNALEKFKTKQKATRKIELWEAEHPDDSKVLFDDVKEYQKSIGTMNVSDKIVRQKPGYLLAMLHGLLSLVSLPLFLYGWANYFFSLWLPSLIVRKKMRDKSFWATFEFVLWIILIPVFALLQTFLVWVFTKDLWIVLAYFVTLPLFGKISMYLAGYYKNTIQRFRFLAAGKAKEKIVALRGKISNLINQLVN